LSDHLIQTQIEGYSRRLLPGVEWLSVSNHLSVCELCRRRVEDAAGGEAVYLALKSEVSDGEFSSTMKRTHLTFEQLAGFVDRAIAGVELQVVKDHLTCCEECKTEVDDLRAFNDQAAPELERENRPSPVGEAIERGWRRWVAALTSFRLKSLVFGSALALLLLAVAGWLAWLALLEMKGKPKVVVTAPSPSVSPSVTPTSTPEGTGAQVIARLNDGKGQVVLDQEGWLSGVDHLPPAYRRMVKRALIDQEIERSLLLAGLTQPGIMARGDDQNRRGKLSVIEPVGTVALSDHPTFRWSQLDGATGYVVEIYDKKLDLVTTSPQVTDQSWTMPQSLERGGIYSWQVKASKDDQEFKSPEPHEPQAKFRILDQDAFNKLAQARRTYGSSHLTMGLLYAQAGLLAEAEREFRTLQKANQDSAIARQLLRRIRAMRRVHST
jgi:hypothetical protein